MGRRSRSLDLVDRILFAVVASVVALIAIRFSGLAIGPTTVALSALPLSLPLLLAALVVSLVRRARIRASVTLICIALIGLWWIPVFTTGPTSVLAASDGRTISSLRIMSFNTMGAESTAEHIVQAARNENVDVLVLSEMKPVLSRRLGQLGLQKSLHFHVSITRADGVEVWAKVPLHKVRELNLKHDGDEIRITTADHLHRHVTLFAVHPASPRWFNAREWQSDQTRLHDDVRTSTGPTLIAGDLNMTRDHAPFRRLMSEGFVDALDVTAGGWQPTWSLGANRIPLATIDHILGKQVGFSDYRTLGIKGSDHRAVIATALIPAALG